MEALEKKVKNMKVEDLMKKHTEKAQADRKSNEKIVSEQKPKANGNTNGTAATDKKHGESKRDRSRSNRKEKRKEAKSRDGSVCSGNLVEPRWQQFRVQRPPKEEAQTQTL